MRWVVTLVSLALVASACSQHGAELSRFGLTDDRYALRVAFARPGIFVSDEWMVENLVRVEPGTAEHKRGPSFEAIYRIDVDNDGRAETFREHAYVVKLRHRQNVGVLWSAVVPLPRSMAETDLRVLARLLVDAASRDTVTLSVVDRSLEVDSRRLATRVLAEGPEAVRGFEGYRVVFEVADVDQQSVAPNTSWERREVLLARPGFVWLAHGRTPMPTVLVLGHANLPDDFETTRPDFARFIEAIDFREVELEPARNALLECAPNHLLASVAVGATYPFSATGIGLSQSELQCLAEAYPDGAPAISFGARRVPFIPPSPPAATPETVDSPSSEPIAPLPPTGAEPAESTPAPAEP